MISQFDLQNYGPVTRAQGSDLAKISLIIGSNGCGKTFLLKALYSAIRAQEETGRGNDNRDFSDVLSEKLYWTFQVEKLGDIVAKGAGNRLRASITRDDNSALVFEFGPDTTRNVSPTYNNLGQRGANSVFVPPKEVLTLQSVILKSVDQDRVFGFDATYADLARALLTSTQKGGNYRSFAQSRQKLETMFDGKISFDEESATWAYKQGNRKFSISVTAEGIKKIAILDRLLGNRYISPDSILFIDEPESALHPTAITQLMDIVKVLADQGIQFFIASHSYFVIKKLQLIARQHQQALPVFTTQDDGTWQQSCLLADGLPDNEIINESIRLFEQEFEGI